MAAPAKKATAAPATKIAAKASGLQIPMGVPGKATGPPPVSKRIFDKYDTGKTGSIKVDQFKLLCYDLGHLLTDQEVQFAVKVIDSDGSGTIEYNEFLKWWREEDKFGKLKLSDDEANKLQTAASYFASLDKDQSGSIDKEEFAQLYTDLSAKGLTKKSLDNCLADLDTNRDGLIQFGEYIEWLVRIGSLPVKVLGVTAKPN